MDDQRRCRGSALTSAMLLCAALIPLGLYVSLRAELDVHVQEHTRRALEAFYVAESGLEHALADLAWQPTFGRLTAGPDGRDGTLDDRFYPFRDPPAPFFPAAPFHYRVEVERIDVSSVDVVAYGHGIGSSLRAVAARVRRSAAPHVPAAVFTADPEVVTLGDALVIRGASSAASGDDLPAIATEDEPDLEVILSHLSSAARRNIAGADGSPNVRTGGFEALGGLSSELARLAGAQSLPWSVQGPLGQGVFAAPQSVEIDDADGEGILVVDGNLLLNGRFSFTGIILVAGDVHAQPGSSLELSGALLQARPGRQLRLEGDGRISYDLDAIALADALSGQLLPRRAIVGGWRERL